MNPELGPGWLFFINFFYLEFIMSATKTISDFTSRQRIASVLQSRLGVVATVADDSDISPKGNHLRWFFPRSLGFPRDGCEVWRIPYDHWRFRRFQDDLSTTIDFRSTSLAEVGAGALNWSGRDRHFALHSNLEMVISSSAMLTVEDHQLKLVKTGGSKSMLLRFRSPVIHVRLELEEPAGDVVEQRCIRGYHRSALLAEARLEKIVDLEQPGLTDLIIPLAFKGIKRILFIREADVVEAVAAKRLGEPIHTLQLPQSADQAFELLSPDLALGITNRFLQTGSMQTVMNRYRPADVSLLVHSLQGSIDQPHATVTAPGLAGQGAFPVQILDHLLLAALDPNIARMLISYWVDHTDIQSLYLVAAKYNVDEKKQTYGFGFSHQSVGVPRIISPAVARQLEGIDYQTAEPRGRVGLEWHRPVGDYRMQGRPVFFDVEREADGLSIPLTQDRPQMIGSRSPYCFHDRFPVGTKVRYRITPIDIFGRSGPSVRTNELQLRDLETPMPPKNVQALLIQEGFPWQRPALRNGPDIKKAVLAATAEFSEAQRSASPYADKIRWWYRLGTLPANDLDPSSWILLATQDLPPPLEGEVIWNPEVAFNEFSVRIKEIKPMLIIEGEQTSGRLAPLLVDAGEAAEVTGAGSGLLQFLLNSPLLEPGLFDGYRIITPDGVITVVGTHAGIAGKDDDGDRQRTARLIVHETTAAKLLQPGATILLQPPAETGSGELVPLARVTLQVPLGKAYDGTVGGEVAIDFHYVTEADTGGSGGRILPVDRHESGEFKKQGVIVGRLVSDVQSDDKTSTFLLRLKPADYQRLMLISMLDEKILTLARYHPPQSLPETDVGLNGAAGTIEIFMPPGQRYITLCLSATMVDNRGWESSRLAAAAEVRIMNPPPLTTPAPPFPIHGGQRTPYGEASLPDRDGHSTMRIGWQTLQLTDGSGDGVRYELARALDTSIVASDKGQWLRGDDTTHFAELEIEPAPEISGRLQAGYTLINGHGAFTVTVKTVDQGEAAGLVGMKGRIRITHLFGTPVGQVMEVYHRLLKVEVGNNGVTLLCQPHFEADADSMGTIIDNAGFAVQAMPDYTAVLTNEDRLRTLADLRYTSGELADEGRTESAFGIVTGIPVEGTEFVDMVPGRGRNRFFYKVRAVFAGEARSAWSPASVAFRQLDLFPADPPEIIRVRFGKAGAFITLTRPVGTSVKGLRLLTASADGSLSEIAVHAFKPSRGQRLLSTQPIRAAGRLVDLRRLLQEARSLLDGEPELAGVFDAAVNRDAPPGDSDLRGKASRLAHGTVELARAIPAEQPLVVRLASGGASAWVSHIESLVEITVDMAVLVEGALRVQTIKETNSGGRLINLDSSPVRVGVG